MSERKRIWGARILLILTYVGLLCGTIFGLGQITTIDTETIWPVSSHHPLWAILMVPGWVIIGVSAVVLVFRSLYNFAYALYHLHRIASRKPLKRPWSHRWTMGEKNDPALLGWKPGMELAKRKRLFVRLFFK